MEFGRGGRDPCCLISTTRQVRPLRRRLAHPFQHLGHVHRVVAQPADVVRLIDDHYPDVRKIINQTERRVQGTKLVYVQEQTVEAQLLTLLQAGQLRPIRELLLSTKPEFTALYRYLFDVVVGQYEGVQSPVATARRREAALAISEYAYRDAIVPDRELQFAACCLKLMDLK